MLKILISDSMPKTVSQILPSPVGIYSIRKQVVWVGYDLGRKRSALSAISPPSPLHVASRDKYKNCCMGMDGGIEQRQGWVWVRSDFYASRNVLAGPTGRIKVRQSTIFSCRGGNFKLVMWGSYWLKRLESINSTSPKKMRILNSVHATSSADCWPFIKLTYESMRVGTYTISAAIQQWRPNLPSSNESPYMNRNYNLAYLLSTNPKGARSYSCWKFPPQEGGESGWAQPEDFSVTLSSPAGGRWR